jgi:hypothetical protein
MVERARTQRAHGCTQVLALEGPGWWRLRIQQARWSHEEGIVLEGFSGRISAGRMLS